MNKDKLLELMLEVAVPQWIEKLKYKSYEDFEKRRNYLSTKIGTEGDIILFKSKKSGRTADAFNCLAEGLAWLALVAKDGVTFGDQHWEASFVKK